MSTPANTILSRAEALIRDTGARLTQPRVRVLAFLLRKKKAMRHQDLLAQLPGEPLDSVTLYRVLGWLTDHGIVQRLVGTDQVWRFAAILDEGGHDHAHFQCTKCDAVTCVTEMPLPASVPLPAGFSSEKVDLMIKGTCARCARR